MGMPPSFSNINDMVIYDTAETKSASPRRREREEEEEEEEEEEYRYLKSGSHPLKTHSGLGPSQYSW
jgi:hypothetical protein